MMRKAAWCVLVLTSIACGACSKNGGGDDQGSSELSTVAREGGVAVSRIHVEVDPTAKCEVAESFIMGDEPLGMDMVYCRVKTSGVETEVLIGCGQLEAPAPGYQIILTQPDSKAGEIAVRVRFDAPHSLGAPGTQPIDDVCIQGNVVIDEPRLGDVQVIQFDIDVCDDHRFLLGTQPLLDDVIKGCLQIDEMK